MASAIRDKGQRINHIDNNSIKAAGFPFMIGKSSWTSTDRPNAPLRMFNWSKEYNATYNGFIDDAVAKEKAYKAKVEENNASLKAILTEREIFAGEISGMQTDLDSAEIGENEVYAEISGNRLGHLNNAIVHGGNANTSILYRVDLTVKLDDNNSFPAESDVSGRFNELDISFGTGSSDVSFSFYTDLSGDFDSAKKLDFVSIDSPIIENDFDDKKDGVSGNLDTLKELDAETTTMNEELSRAFLHESLTAKTTAQTAAKNALYSYKPPAGKGNFISGIGMRYN